MLPLVLLAIVVSADDCQESRLLARRSYEQRHYQEAAQHFARALEACGQSSPLLLALGQAHLLARRPAEALTTLDRIAASDSDYPAALKVKAKATVALVVGA